ncbi:MAG: nascent polypeptide-associated complex protein [Thermoplasmata archaeon HGW-Thermoplasmata-1]|nr:MAG: nascent polypeptide-associated complex protein [Thermoplasmata archaeon HGW-Thermoplasmata-1]
MMPGMGKMNAKQMNMMMRRLGINVEEIPDVEQVVIKTPTKDYVFRDAEVTIMNTPQGKTYQLSGTPTVVNKAGAAEEQKNRAAETAAVTGSMDDVVLEISDDDVALVAGQAGVDNKTARKALEEAKGDIAEAIMKLSG